MLTLQSGCCVQTVLSSRYRARNDSSPGGATRGNLMEIKKVGVLGCGLMGSGIAQVAATAGFDVTVLEVEQKFLDKGFAGIEKSLGKFAEKGVLREPLETVQIG